MILLGQAFEGMQYIQLILFFLVIGGIAAAISILAGLISFKSRVARWAGVLAISLGVLPTLAWLILIGSNAVPDAYVLTASPALAGLLGVALSMRPRIKSLDPEPAPGPYRFRFTLGQMLLWMTVCSVVFAIFWQTYYRHALGHRHIHSLVQGDKRYRITHAEIHSRGFSDALTGEAVRSLEAILWQAKSRQLSDAEVKQKTDAWEQDKWGLPSDQRNRSLSYLHAVVHFDDGAIGSVSLHTDHSLELVEISYDGTTHADWPEMSTVSATSQDRQLLDASRNLAGRWEAAKRSERTCINLKDDM